MSQKMYVATLEHLDDGSSVLIFPPDLLSELGWQEGDVIDIGIDEERNQIRFIKVKDNHAE